MSNPNLNVMSVAFKSSEALECIRKLKDLEVIDPEFARRLQNKVTGPWLEERSKHRQG